MYAANVAPNKAYAIRPAVYPFLAALSVNVGVHPVIILGCFLFWSLPSMIANTFMPIRSFFACRSTAHAGEARDVNDRRTRPSSRSSW